MNFRDLPPIYFNFKAEILIFATPIQPGQPAGTKREGGAVAQSVEQRTENAIHHSILARVLANFPSKCAKE
jgi:hypothetical protein